MHLAPSAGDMWEELNTRGYELHFDLDSQGAAEITLRDLDGRFVRGVTATEAVEIASTRPGSALDRLLRS